MIASLGSRAIPSESSSVCTRVPPSKTPVRGHSFCSQKPRGRRAAGKHGLQHPRSVTHIVNVARTCRRWQRTRTNIPKEQLNSVTNERANAPLNNAGSQQCKFSTMQALNNAGSHPDRLQCREWSDGAREIGQCSASPQRGLEAASLQWPTPPRTRGW
jgi:hypothetical protein